MIHALRSLRPEDAGFSCAAEVVRPTSLQRLRF
jgi:hypothetical protein